MVQVAKASNGSISPNALGEVDNTVYLDGINPLMAQREQTRRWRRAR